MVHTNGCPLITLCVKLFFPFQFQLGTVKLAEKKNAFEVTRVIFEHAIAVSNELVENTASLKADNERLTTDRSNALKRLDKCITAKEKLEADMYAKVNMS